MFYLTLPSNSSLDFFPENTLTHYKVRLPYTIALDGQWEVGLAEIQYPHTWYNVQGSACNIRVCSKPGGAISVDKALTLSNGYYQDVSTLVECINRQLSSKLDLPEEIAFRYDTITQKVALRITDAYRIKLDPGLHRLLGFDEKEDWLSSSHCQGRYVADLAQGFHNLYVYTDIVESRAVGDCLVPLLRIVPIQGNNGDVVDVVCNPVHYVPLQFKHFQTIDVYIRDDAGSPVPFERGKVVVTLHLRRRPWLAQR